MKYAVLTLVIAVAGCASNTGVVKTGSGNYMLAKQAATGFSGLGNLKAEAIQEASLYCEKQGKELQLTGSTETQPPYILGNYPRSEIQFNCK